MVDDAIIVVDNALKRLKLNARKPPEEQFSPKKVIFTASKEIMASIFNATIIIIVAFLPLFFLSGMEGSLLKPLGISFIVSLFASLIVALSLTPVMCSYLLTSEKQLMRHETGTRWVRWLNEKYGKILDIAIKVFGTDLQKMFSVANQIKTNIEGIEGLVDISVEQQVEIPQIQIKPRREMLKQYGIPVNEFAEFVDIAFAGEKVSEVYEENMSFDLVLIYKDTYRNSIEAIKNSLIDTYDSRKVPLKEVAEIVSSTGPNTISRENVKRKVVISANVSGRDLRGVVNDVQSIVKEIINFPENDYIEYGGQFESEEMGE